MNANSTLPPPLPNPFTVLAFLPPTLASQYQAAIYVFVASVSALSWDWLMSLTEEFAMCRSRKLRLPIVAYFLSRVATIAYCTLALVFQSGRVVNCNALLCAIGGCYVVAVSSTSALFFFRVKGVYGNDKYVTAFFGSLWFTLFALSFLVPPAVRGTHIGDTQRCIVTSVANYAPTPVVLNTIIDTIVFLAISLRITSYSIEGDTFTQSVKSFWSGDGLPKFSKSLLQGGQLYYSATIGLNIVAVVMLFAPVPALFHAMFSIPNIALESAMATRVFRSIRLGTIDDAATTLNAKSATSRNRSIATGTSKENYGLKFRPFEASSRQGAVTVDMTDMTGSGEQ